MLQSLRERDIYMEGFEEGFIEGYAGEYAKARNEISLLFVRGLMKRFDYTAQEAMKLLGIPPTEWADLLEILDSRHHETANPNL